jgi:hypothetical protein
MLTPLVLVVLGLVLAFAGQRFIWLLIGLAGFVLGYDLVTFFIPDQAGTVQLIIGVVVGLIGVFLARKFTHILLVVAGFVLVGNALLAIGTALNIEGGFAQLLLFVVGGLIGLALVRMALKWAIILISVLGGASMVMLGLPDLLNREPGALMLLGGLVVVVAGFIVQARAAGKAP